VRNPFFRPKFVRFEDFCPNSLINCENIRYLIEPMRELFKSRGRSNLNGHRKGFVTKMFSHFRVRSATQTVRRPVLSNLRVTSCDSIGRTYAQPSENWASEGHLRCGFISQVAFIPAVSREVGVRAIVWREKSERSS
jgi:hypothetical protein